MTYTQLSTPLQPVWKAKVLPTLLRRALPLCLALLLAQTANAQCPGYWPTVPSNFQTNATIAAATMWDPDGPGPHAPVLVVGGDFIRAGSVFTWSQAAAYDFETDQWSALGTVVSSTVWALAVLHNGDLVAAGNMHHSVVRWNGAEWVALGTIGDTSSVLTLAVAPNGDLFAGGVFTAFNGLPIRGIARWDGATWSPLGSGVLGIAGGHGEVWSIKALPNGDLIVGGTFATAGGVPAANIARWNGTTWSALGSGLDGGVRAVAQLANGDIVAGGDFGLSGGTAIQYMARWNGSSWAAFGEPSNRVYALATLANGNLIAGGDFLSINHSQNYIAAWNGTTWTRLDDGREGTVANFVPCPDGRLFVTERFPPGSPNIALYISPRTADFNGDGDTGTDADIEAFFACLGGNCCSTCPPNSDFNGDGDIGTDADIESFFRVLGGGPC